MLRRRATPRRATGRDHGDVQTAWHIVRYRQGGACWLCPCPMEHAHHRQTRRHGPDCPANLLGLCEAHHRMVHANPNASIVAGWIVSRHATDPCRVTVLDAQGVEWELTCGGTRILHEP